MFLWLSVEIAWWIELQQPVNSSELLYAARSVVPNTDWITGLTVKLAQAVCNHAWLFFVGMPTYTVQEE